MMAPSEFFKRHPEVWEVWLVTRVHNDAEKGVSTEINFKFSQTGDDWSPQELEKGALRADLEELGDWLAVNSAT